MQRPKAIGIRRNAMARLESLPDACLGWWWYARWWSRLAFESIGGESTPNDPQVTGYSGLTDRMFSEKPTGCVGTRNVKTRYRGLAKNRAQLFTQFALGNLFLVRRMLMA